MTPQLNTNASPLSLKALLTLFFAPGHYFSDLSRLPKRPELIIIIWLSGVAYVMEKIDTNLIWTELGARQGLKVALNAWLTESWFNYWAFVLGIGVICGFVAWYLGGWWYQKRLNWSGAKDVSPTSARLVYVYQDVVQSLPVVLVSIVQTLMYFNYMEAWEADEYWSSMVGIFFFWSCFTSYRAVQTTFSVQVWKARIWFLILPVAIMIIGLMGALVSWID